MEENRVFGLWKWLPTPLRSKHSRCPCWGLILDPAYMGLKVLILLFNADDDLQSTSAANPSLDYCVHCLRRVCKSMSSQTWTPTFIVVPNPPFLPSKDPYDHKVQQLTLQHLLQCFRNLRSARYPKTMQKFHLNSLKLAPLIHLLTCNNNPRLITSSC